MGTAKKDLFNRIVQEFDGLSTKEFLSLFSYETLNQIRKDNDIKIKGLFGSPLITKNQIIDSLVENIVLKSNKKIERKEEKIIEEKIVENDASPVKEKKPLFSIPKFENRLSEFYKLVETVEDWTPRKRYSSEDGYRADLCGFIEGKGFKTRMEEGESHPDILVNDSIPIEMKKDPKSGDYDRAVGQVIRHYNAHGSVIVVICDVKKRDQFEDFSANILLSIPKEKIRILKK